MIEAQFADLTSGYERFDALKKNLEGIFDKIYRMKEYRLDISYYEQKFEEFKEEFEENITPIYNIYLLLSGVADKLNDYNDEDIEDVTIQTIKLIDQINSISTHNKIDVKRLLDKAYNTIFDALLYEKAYNRREILDYLNTRGLSSNRENLSEVLRSKVHYLISRGILDKKEVDEEFLKHLDEGLGYDYLSDEFLETISKKVMPDKHDSIHYRGEIVKDRMIKTIKSSNNTYKSLLMDSKKIDETISQLKKVRAKLAVTTAAIILVPIISLAAGLGIGRIASNNVDEYATITRNVNIETGAVVGGESKVYDERSTTYVATITVYEPWRKNPTGVGYIRNATAYEYIVPENTSDNYHVTVEDIEGNLREKYKFNEPKDKLDPEDSMTDSVIIVTETYQDKTDTQKSSKYVVPFGLTAFFLSSILGGLYLHYKKINFNDLTNERNRVNNKLVNNKTSKEDVRKRLEEIKEQIAIIQREKEQAEKDYDIKIPIEVFKSVEEVERHM